MDSDSPQHPSMIRLHELTIRYDKLVVVPELSVDIKRGEFFTLLGPSGCGKSTVLRAIAGFVPVASGEVYLNGQNVTDQPAEQRDVGIVFQNYALFPHMTVRANVAFGLKVANTKAAEIKRRVDRILESTGISEHAQKKPESLSGGQQQRVAIARSLVMGTQVLLFDEPLSNLDARVRDSMRTEIKRLQRELDFTAVYVTHDQEEALSMSDRLLVFNQGVADHIGTAKEIYSRPATPFVCEFVGASTKLGERTKTVLDIDTAVDAYIRPEDVSLIDSGGLPVTIADIDFLGASSTVLVEFQGELLKVSVTGAESVDGLEPGRELSLRVNTRKILYFENDRLVQ